jgi:hypothetical protein
VPTSGELIDLAQLHAIIPIGFSAAISKPIRRQLIGKPQPQSRFGHRNVMPQRTFLNLFCVSSPRSYFFEQGLA